MPLLLTSDAIADRRRIAAGALAPLADSLSADLERAIAAGIRVPRDKALLSRAGGYCERDGSALAFDPWSPHEHRCPTCGQVHRGTLHDRWWLYPYQLWLAERAVHAAALYAVRGDDRHAVFARDILRQYADAYLTYPNRDNVLGPTRPFFSTYLESIWLLQLCVAVDLLETAGDQSVGAEFRDRVVEPSAALIAAYNEGASNRQIWNNAALIAAHVLLGNDHALEALVAGPSGLLAHLEDGILDDGTWYEGENYHQFAHRGLWYGVMLAERAGLALPPGIAPRFERGFAATFATALPDLTLPSRKDSQYATSLRQWRFAESCELGLARRDDPVLGAMLARLYDGDAPAGDTGRASASAEAERNVRGVRLTRADLGWKSLLFAREQVASAGVHALPSVLLDGQGIAVIRRPGSDAYVALDYGQSGGGHGHPDRLNVLFSTGATRWLDDLGTASYVDPSLHWYRSTLAHNAPMVGGHSQWRVDGVLEAFDEQGDAGWVRARATIWPGVVVQRTLVVMSGYFVDEIRWRAGHDTVFMLPLHCDGALSGQIKQVRAQYVGAGGSEDGDRFVTTDRAFRVAAGAGVHLTAHHGTDEVRAFLQCQSHATWYSLSGPGQPPGASRRFHLIESRGTPVGVIRAVWAWSRDVESVEWTADEVIVHHRDGTRHLHAGTGGGWHVEVDSNGGWRTIELGGVRADDELMAHAEPGDEMPSPDVLPADRRGVDSVATGEPMMRGFHGLVLAPSRFAAAWWTDASDEERSRFAAYHLGEPTYRRSEVTWEDAGRPSARVAIAAAPKLIVVDVQVATPAPRFVPAGAVNPYDNEPADINGDGVQLYVRTREDGGAWVLVPDDVGKAGAVRARPLAGWGDLRLSRVAWRRVRDGYELRAEIALRQPLEVGGEFSLDVLVNETAPGRERRRGQLILSGPDGEFVYLRGDRHDPARLLHFTVVT